MTAKTYAQCQECHMPMDQHKMSCSHRTVGHYTVPMKRPDKIETPKPGTLRVWWIPDVPGKPWHYYVDTFPEGALILDALADYDTFLYGEGVRNDYSNAGGLEVFCAGDMESSEAWEEWEDEDGRDIAEILSEMHEK